MPIEQNPPPRDDDPPHPWDTPSPEAQAKAEPARDALKQALRKIETPEQADKVADTLLEAARSSTEQDIREAGAAAEPVQAIQQAAATPGRAGAAATLLNAAKQVAESSGETREALEQAIQSATNPEQQGTIDPATEVQRDLLREAIIRRMRPFQALDTRLFLAINHLPHNRAVNTLMSTLTLVMTAGGGWVIGLIVAMLWNRRYRQALLQIVPPLWFATITVEYPVKYYFRRKRPFIDIVQAVAVGRKPGTYSFPSGHSASAFAGAWLLTTRFPRFAALWYLIATLVGFSRIYLGAHYPGDVVSGALVGSLLAEATRRAINAGDD